MVPSQGPHGRRRMHLVAPKQAFLASWSANGRMVATIHTACGVTVTSGRLYVEPPDVQLCDNCVLDDEVQWQTVYRAFSATGRLLYVGYSGRILERLASHRRSSSWWPEAARVDIQRFPTGHEARAAEKVALRTEGPLHNSIRTYFGPSAA